MMKKLHFVGAGGIGMSALAQMASSLGIETTGSDRAAGAPENKRIFQALEAQGVKIFPQDGSVYAGGNAPDAIVYSTAIEEDNPDFAKAPSGTRRLHRSAAMEILIRQVKAENVIAISGTCGKTSVTALLGETLWRLGADPGMLCGGLVNAFASEALAGNYRAGHGKCFVIEADESDKSLLNYTADTALVLNIGTDHYSREELREVFRKFVNNTTSNIVLSEDVKAEIFGCDSAAELAGKNIAVFGALDSYEVRNGTAYCAFAGERAIALRCPGEHNALNAYAVYETLKLLGFEPAAILDALENFSGVWRRFDIAGKTESGAAVYDDYAHNVEKLLSCYHSACAVADGRVFLVFQPHGYGPFGFMREELFAALEANLRPGDVFAFLPVYYAGGTSSFKPKSEEVAADFRRRSEKAERYPDFTDRTEAEAYLRKNAEAGDVIVVAGARDNSLSDWAAQIR